MKTTESVVSQKSYKLEKINKIDLHCDTLFPMYDKYHYHTMTEYRKSVRHIPLLYFDYMVIDLTYSVRNREGQELKIETLWCEYDYKREVWTIETETWTWNGRKGRPMYKWTQETSSKQAAPKEIIEKFLSSLPK